MPVDFLTTEQTESYGRFTGEPDELQLARYFHLDEADKEFIGKSRGDHNRLGIALQIGCVRFLGTFLTDMNHIPSGVRHFTARQLGIRDITVLAEYGQRENTRREHAALIRQHYQYREFAWPWTFRRHCCKVSDEAAFCLIQRPYISKTLLTRRISPRGSP